MKSVILAGVQQNGLAINLGPEWLKMDPEVVLAAVLLHGGDVFRFAADSLRSDRQTVLSVVQRRGSALAFATPRLKYDRGMLELADSLQGGGRIDKADALQLWEDAQDGRGVTARVCLCGRPLCADPPCEESEHWHD